jgi:hypothetical protein
VDAEMTPHLWTASAKMLVLIVRALQVFWTRNPEVARKTFDLIGAKEKELYWIEGTTRRFKDG